ncbi:MAG TPA: hypothetical protein VE266_04330 [Steroidobacteraceae bacterium]|nr:hypothetical protein [Steroidobacteraceae bacterium]
MSRSELRFDGRVLDPESGELERACRVAALAVAALLWRLRCAGG